MANTTPQCSLPMSGWESNCSRTKIRKLKSRIAKFKAISDKNKAKIPPTTIFKSSTKNMNIVKSEKYGTSLNEIEKKSLTSERFKTLFNFERIKGLKIICDRLDKYN